MANVEELHLTAEAPGCEDDNRKTATIIRRRICSEVSYNEFFWHYMSSNWPICLTDSSNDWECRNHWILPTSNSGTTETINFTHLREKICDRPVPVADCSKIYFNSHEKKEIQFYDFLDYWKIQTTTNYKDDDGKQGNIISSTDTDTENLYLKDWHLQSQMPDYRFYHVPKHFASDWLNEYLVANGRDDYRFVYMGPKGTWTPFHADVFGSFSWSTNIVGCKKWILLPPGEELKLTDGLGNLPFSIDEQQLQSKQVRFFTLLQGENEALFVPSGWYHQVWNLSDTISINHNWFNACNVQRIWTNLSAAMRQVIAEIEDCRQMDNFDEHCQTMLRATFGINYTDFLDMIEFISDRRVTAIAEPSEKSRLTDSYTPNDFHLRYDLKSIHAVVQSMIEDSVICNSRVTLYRRCVRLLEKVETF